MADGTPGSATGESAAGILLGGHRVELGLQLVPYRRNGILRSEERDRAFELAAVVAQLVGRQRPEGMFGLFYWHLLGGCDGRHRLESFDGGVGWRFSLPKLPAGEDNWLRGVRACHDRPRPPAATAEVRHNGPT